MLSLLTALALALTPTPADGGAVDGPDLHHGAVDATRADVAPPPIIGGEQAHNGEWPDSVVLFVGNNMNFCTGTLIAPDVVLTAGHCLTSDYARYPISVRLNSVDRVSGGEVITVASKHVYPGYYTGSSVPDLGVLRLSRASEQVEPRPIIGDCVTEEYGQDAPVTLVGWGLAYPNANRSPQFQQEVELTITDPECNSPGCEPSQRPGGQFYIYNNGKSAAPGDSGGPVYLMSEHGPHLVGVMSQAAQGYVTISVRPDKYIDWIQGVAETPLARPWCGNAPEPEADDIVTKGRKWGTTVVQAMDKDDEDSHSYEIVEDPAFGEATIDQGGLVSYRADRKFNGEDSVTVRVTDDSEYALEGEVEVKVQVEQGGMCSTAPASTGLGLGLFGLLLGIVRRRRR